MPSEAVDLDHRQFVGRGLKDRPIVVCLREFAASAFIFTPSTFSILLHRGSR
jgi:hypothetical protein